VSSTEETTLGTHANGISSRLGQQTQHEERRGGSAIANPSLAWRGFMTKGIGLKEMVGWITWC
jgi:hypothetical protein